MNASNRIIYLICGDSAVAQRCNEALAAYGTHYRISTASTVDQARKALSRNAPATVYLDESAVDTRGAGDALEMSAALLAQFGPVVVAAAPRCKRVSLI